MTEPWMSGSYADVDALLRPVLHSIDHVKQDVAKWSEGLSTEQLQARPGDTGAAGVHIRRITGSSERLFTYARGEMLSGSQLAAMNAEEEPGASREELLSALNQTLDAIADAVRAIDPNTLQEPRTI